MLALKVRQPEDDIVAVRDGDPEALEQEHDEVGAARGRTIAARVVRGEREAHVDLERREVEIVVEVLATQTHRCGRVLPELFPKSFLLYERQCCVSIEQFFLLFVSKPPSKSCFNL
jgi:hypothetical protein